ncbi:MAG: hypothetical protein AAB874_02980, partial [Patescibacteria group bacterium]
RQMHARSQRRVVEIPIAIAHLLQKDEGTAQTVILIGIEGTHFVISLFKIGKMVHSITQVRSESISQDVESALTSFTDVEVLPSRVLIYGSGDLEIIKTELLNHPWQKKANFLHFPKIEILASDFGVKAVAVASGSEIVYQSPEETTVSESKEQEIEEREAPDLDFVKEEENAEVEAVHSAEVDIDNETAVVAPVTSLQNQTVSGPDQKKSKGWQLPKFSTLIPRLSFTLRIPKVSRVGSVIAVILLLTFLFTGFLGATYYFLPTATIRLLVSTKTRNQQEEITIDPNVSEPDIEKKILPGKEIAFEVNGSKSIKTSGKKTVGEKAKGEVTVYNKTLNSKVFKKGTTLLAAKLKFTLDEEINVASASESVGALTYGTTKAQITANDIGSASNVGAGTEFTFTDLPGSSYSARNDKVFSGVSSREIAVVTREDQASLKEQAVSDLEEKAKNEITAKLTSGDKLLENSLSSKITKEVFDKELGEEADNIVVDLTLSAIAFSYSQTDFDEFLERLIAGGVPSSYTYKPEDVKIHVENVREGEGDARIFDTTIVLTLTPKLDTSELAQKLSGRTQSEATSYLQSISGVSGVEFEMKAPFDFLKKQLPRNKNNIKIEVSPL